MVKKVFEVREVPGSRRSSDRDYSHAVIGRYDHSVAAAAEEAGWVAGRKKNVAWERKNWEYRAADAKRVVGEIRKNHSGFMMPVRDYEIEISAKFISENPSLDGYIARLESEFAARIAAMKAKPIDEFGVLRWSMSYKNAFNALGSFAAGFVDLKVVEVVRVK